jgi:hypothetical protein
MVLAAFPPRFSRTMRALTTTQRIRLRGLRRSAEALQSIGRLVASPYAAATPFPGGFTVLRYAIRGTQATGAAGTQLMPNDPILDHHAPAAAARFRASP